MIVNQNEEFDNEPEGKTILIIQSKLLSIRETNCSIYLPLLLKIQFLIGKIYILFLILYLKAYNNT